MKDKLERLEVKEEIVSIQEDTLPSSIVEDTCTVYKQKDTFPYSTVDDTFTVYKQEEDAQMEFTEIKGKHLFQI